MTLVAELVLALAALALAILWGLPARRGARTLQPASARMRAPWLRLALRSGALALALLYGAAKAWHASAGLAAPARWWLCGAAAVLLLPLFVNTAAGLWFLLRLGPDGLASSLTILGHTGRVHHVGLTRVALAEDGERVVLLPHWALAWQPLTLARGATTVASRLVLERDSWSEEQRRFLLQAAILSPYRDAGCPVSVSVSGRIANVNVSILRPEAHDLLRRALERALQEHERSRSESQGPAQPPHPAQ